MNKWLQGLVAVTCLVVLSIAGVWAYEQYDLSELFEERLISDEEARGPNADCLVFVRAWDRHGPDYLKKELEWMTQEYIDQCRLKISSQ